MTQFTPIASLAGGVLIGLAASFLMALNGRIAGISGITAGLLSWSKPDADWAWRAAFILGLVATPLLLNAGGFTMPAISFVTSAPGMAVAGALVGFGTVLGNGCTSGHGVCGIARLSSRSLAATLVFLAAGVATVFATHHVMK